MINFPGYAYHGLTACSYLQSECQPLIESHSFRCHSHSLRVDCYKQTVPVLRLIQGARRLWLDITLTVLDTDPGQNLRNFPSL